MKGRSLRDRTDSAQVLPTSNADVRGDNYLPQTLLDRHLPYMWYQFVAMSQLMPFASFLSPGWAIFGRPLRLFLTSVLLPFWGGFLCLPLTTPPPYTSAFAPLPLRPLVRETMKTTRHTRQLPCIPHAVKGASVSAFMPRLR